MSFGPLARIPLTGPRFKKIAERFEKLSIPEDLYADKR
jgi:hypothetical protein